MSSKKVIASAAGGAALAAAALAMSCRSRPAQGSGPLDRARDLWARCPSCPKPGRRR
ncbi:hypothetical protein [Streptomyces sp. CB03238]|uniref:hypothetical protein n=1 Tax=Streptomyces sp. CB03238 TaxID=1907777 RepID=UPI0015C497FD|nr:hypothetical protein [Streptomyces sp. CB03238]